VTGAKENELEAELSAITVNTDVTAWWQHDNLIIVESQSLHKLPNTKPMHSWVRI